MKKHYMVRRIIFIIALSAGCIGLQAQEERSTVNITTTAVPFLRISPDARSGGMGDAGIALSPDANSGFYNLAKTPFAKDRIAIGATYTPWLKDVADGMYLATLAGYYQLRDGQGLSASLRYFSAGDIDLVDYNGNKLQSARPREFAIDLGYSRKLSEKFGIAAALRYIHSNLASGQMNGVNYKAGTAVAGDLSVYFNGLNDKDRGWTAGLSLSNLGSKIGYTDDADSKDFLPANLGIGAAYREAWDDDNKMTFALDLNKSLVPKIPANPEEIPAYRKKGVVESWFNSFGNEAWQVSFGGEYAYKQQLYLRLGYSSKTYSYGNWQYVTAGAGVQFGKATVNFSWFIPAGDKVGRNPLANTIRFGVLFGWPDQ